MWKTDEKTGRKRRLAVPEGGIFLALALLACGKGDEETARRAEIPLESARPERRYEKPEGVDFHVPVVLGMKYSAFEGGVVEAGLGKPTGSRKLPGLRGEAITYEAGEIRVVRDQIYAVVHQFTPPVSRLEAIHRSGLPESIASEFKPTTREERIEHSAYGFRRLVLVRSAPDADTFVRLEAWSFLPHERY